MNQEIITKEMENILAMNMMKGIEKDFIENKFGERIFILFINCLFHIAVAYA